MPLDPYTMKQYGLRVQQDILAKKTQHPLPSSS